MEHSKSTPLLAAHRAAGAKLVDFAGFEMPLSYSGIVDEHHAVRREVGLFDVSHMGEVDFRGPQAVAAVDHLVTNSVLALADGQALYSPICYPDGGIVDDCLVYRLGAEHVRVVVNASNVAKDVAWMADNLSGFRCEMHDLSDAFALLALQGPAARELMAELAGPKALEIQPFCLANLVAAGVQCTAARTGYTGEDGFEIFCAPADATALWDALCDKGQRAGLKPCGLGARDTLRLEARLPLYGNDISAETTPLEAGLGWTVKLKGPDFIGKDALLRQKAEGIPRKLVCLEMRSRGIARHGHGLYLSGEEGFAEAVGTITSGTKSPTLDRAIALGYVESAHAKAGTRLKVDVRGKAVEAEVIKGPFYRRIQN